MKKALTWIFGTIGTLIVFGGMAFGLSMVNKNSLAHKYLGQQLPKMSKISLGNNKKSRDSSGESISESQLKNVLGSNKVNGAIATSSNGDVSNASRGYSNFDNKTAFKDSDQFLIGRTQTALNTLLILRLVDQGKLKLSDKLEKYYRSVPGSDQITVKQLMSQTSGLDTLVDAPTDGSTYSFVSWVAGNATFDPGLIGTYKFSPANGLVISGIIQKVSGSQYEEYVKSELIDHLDLKNTSFGSSLKNVAYYNTNREKLTDTDLQSMTVNTYRSDELLSTPQDIARMFEYGFSSKFISSSLLKSEFGTNKSKVFGFKKEGNNIFLEQVLGQGGIRLDWNYSSNVGSVIFSNYASSSKSISKANKTVFEKIN
ncbi:serine hydrolase domain-containing protein [Pediococcus argentinicus]|nr:serine hydrolase domain-containing protein [Pediococcus argentinicus]NKZ22509.1 beta-lactamase family protein [Pediococcus argentinicus]